MRRGVLAWVLVACSSPARPPVRGAPPKPPAIVVQLDYQPSFMIGAQFAGVPPFTLLEDGTLIDGHRGPAVEVVRLPREEVERIRAHVLELGFERLEGRRHCREDQVCGSDDSSTVLRVALPSGELREISTYHGASNEPATEKQITEYLASYPHPRGTRYRPAKAVLHVSVSSAPPPPACVKVDPELVRVRDPSHASWAFALEGPALASLLAVAPTNYGTFAACAGGTSYSLTIIPELPGVDLVKDLAHWLR